MPVVKRNSFIALAVAVVSVAICIYGCVSPTYPLPQLADWNNSAYWYHDSQPVDQDKADVFYVVSTNVISSKNADGQITPLAQLTEEECLAMHKEMSWFRQNIFTLEFNYFSPLYHQVTFEALGTPRGGKSPLWDMAAQEVCQAFDFYMANENQGRRFILAGFSQGASILRAILKHMTDEQYARCIAAYSIGFQVTAEDLESPHIKPAQCANDQGVIISFNSVTSPSGAWELLSGDAACSINPVNWRIDDTPATFEFKGQQATATLDMKNHLIVVEGVEPRKNAFSDYFPKGNLHTSEIFLYKNFLRENALLRAYGGKRF